MSLRYLTAGESHGPALSGILDGMPAGVEITQKDFDLLLQKRWLGYGRGMRRNIESDRVEVLAGIVGGKTTGSPISLLIRNQDYSAHKSAMAPFSEPLKKGALPVPLPGHADFAGAIKYRFDDCRLIRERASARETAMRTALSVPARNLLQTLGIGFTCMVEAIGDVVAEIDYQQHPEKIMADCERNGPEFLTPDAGICEKWRKIIDRAQSENKSLGGTASVIFWNLPVGLGSHTQADSRLDAALAARLMSIPGVKGVEFGRAADQSRSSAAIADAIVYQPGRGFFHASNHAAGVEGGMSNGEPLIVRFHVKPLPGGSRVESVNIQTLEAEMPANYRSDTQAMQAVALVAESVVALELAAQVIKFTGGSDLDTIVERYQLLSRIKSV